MVRTAALVTVRNSSTRLPAKALAEVGYGKKSIEVVLERAKLTGFEVILCTSTDASDDVFEAIAGQNGVRIFRGNLKNKITRWYDCFMENDFEAVLLVDGDDLLYDYEIGSRAVFQLINAGLEMVKAPDDIVCGFFTYALSRKGIEKLYLTAKTYPDTDVITEFIRLSGIHTREVKLNDWERNKKIRLTLDYPEDLEMFRAAFQVLDIQANGKEVVSCFQNNPHLSLINNFRQGEFLQNQENFNKYINPGK
jgi:spore coat polysaccharide biosynthesis protein SpsF (cytidylyltransferase family)